MQGYSNSRPAGNHPRPKRACGYRLLRPKNSHAPCTASNEAGQPAAVGTSSPAGPRFPLGRPRARSATEKPQPLNHRRAGLVEIKTRSGQTRGARRAGGAELVCRVSNSDLRAAAKFVAPPARARRYACPLRQMQADSPVSPSNRSNDVAASATRQRERNMATGRHHREPADHHGPDPTRRHRPPVVRDQRPCADARRAPDQVHPRSGRALAISDQAGDTNFNLEPLAGHNVGEMPK